MSILQDLEMIRKDIPQEERDAMDLYCVMNNEPYTVGYIEETIGIREGTECTSKMLYLNDILYNMEEYAKFNKWYNEKIASRGVVIKDSWVEKDYDLMYFIGSLYESGKYLGDIVEAFEEEELRYNLSSSPHLELSSHLCNCSAQTLIRDSFDKYVNLPRLNKCSKLLQRIYDDVLDSVEAIWFIDEDLWAETYAKEFSEDDLENLWAEVDKYKLEKYIESGYDCLLIGYYDLIRQFLDDRDLQK